MKKNSKKGTILILILTLLFAYFAPIVPVKAASSTATLSVTFRGDNANYGKVQYSLDDGAHWDDITENTANLNLSFSGNNLRLKIVPNNNYSVDYAGIALNLDGNVTSQLSANDFESENGYIVPANTQSVSLEQVEFKSGQGQSNEKITFQLDNATVSGNVITFNVEGTDITATVTGEGYAFNGNNLEVNLSDINNVRIKLSNNFDSSKMRVELHDGQVLAVNGDNEIAFGGLNIGDNNPHLLIVSNNEGGQPGGDNTQNYQGNATATINYKITGAIEYGSGGGFDNGISFRINDTPYIADATKIEFTEDTAYERDGNGKLVLDENDNPIVIKDPDTMQPMTEKTGLIINGDTINYNAETNKVKFTFAMAPGTLMTSLKINNVVINLPRTKAELEACYIDHRLEIDVDNIDKADTYNIEIEARYPNDNEQFLGNFLWDYNPEGYTGPDDKILNATLTFVEAEYNGHTYKTVEEINGLGGVYIWKDAERKSTYENDRDGLGEAQFPVGTKLTLKIIPDAGYQLVDFGINGGVFETQEEIGTYTFVVKGGPFHLQANLAQVEDAVKTKSEKIESGSITLGGTESSMAVGTARLDIEDVTLNKEQIGSFEEAAKGYDIKDYIDISLFNTVFKGKETASWDTEVKDLQNDATIALKLEEDVNGDEVVIVHEKHDGTYEIIQVEYDDETNTIIFKTKSFSNYAIATKTAVKSEIKEETETLTDTEKEISLADNTSNPTTGDNIIMIASMFVIASIGLCITFMVNKDIKTSKH